MSRNPYILLDRNGSFSGVNREVLHVIGLSFLIALTYRIFLSTFLYNLQYFLEIVMQVSVFFYIYYRLVTRSIRKNTRFYGIELYLALLFVLPLMPAIAAYFEFGQPIYFGIITYRNIYLLFGGLLVYNLLREGRISIRTVEHAYVLIAIIFMLFSYIITIFIDPTQLQDTELAGGGSAAKGGEVYYRLNMSMFFFGSIYFVVKYFYKKKLVNLLVAALFIYFLVFIRLDRTSIAFLAFGLSVFFLTALPARTQLLAIARSLLPLAMGAILIGIVEPGLYNKYYTMFLDVFQTADKAGSGSVEDNVRLMELKIAINGFLESPLFGKGKVSNSYVTGGYNHFYGFFYTSDVGVFGYLFSLGILGFTIIMAQFIFAIKYIRGIKHIKYNVFLVSLKFTLLVLALDGITTEFLTIYAGQTIMIILVIFYFYQQDRILDEKIRFDRGVALSNDQRSSQ